MIDTFPAWCRSDRAARALARQILQRAQVGPEDRRADGMLGRRLDAERLEDLPRPAARLHADQRELAAIDLDRDRRVGRAEVEKRLGVEASETREDRVEGAHSTKVTLLISWREVFPAKTLASAPRGGRSCPPPWPRA
jgi:hypothetical protein